MPALTSKGSKPVVLLTNDDGPPSNSSPNIFGFAKHLRDKLGWEVRVVVPDCQKSWVGKAYAISDVIQASYFYPLEPDGLKGEITPYPRPLKEGETMEWVLLSGTPATCSNIALHNLYPGEIDMVISGPNHGRNSSTAFSLSSGTIGAALGAALSVGMDEHSSSSTSPRPFIPAIAVSYGLVERPCPAGAIELAHEVAIGIVDKLWQSWGYECTPTSRHRTQLYTVNVPLVVRDLEKENRKTVWANMWRSAYGSLFKQTSYEADKIPAEFAAHNVIQASTSSPSEPPITDAAQAPPASTKEAGPNALPTPSQTPLPDQNEKKDQPAESQKPLRFKFSPGMKWLLDPPLSALPAGTDGWAFAQGWSTVVPLRAEFGGIVQEETWFEKEDGSRIVPGDTF